jgi:hypothetical protein
VKRKSEIRNPKSEIAAAADAPPASVPLSGLLTIQAAADKDGKPDPSKRPTFALDAYNGGPMQVAGWYRPVIIDGAGVSVAASELPVYVTHELTMGNLVGQTRKGVKVTNGKITAEGDFTAKRESSDAYAQMLDHSSNGYQFQVSVGAGVKEYEMVEAGKSVIVNGKSHAGPVYVARKVTLNHIAIVPLGADTSTSATIAAQSGQENIMKPTFEQWLVAQGKDASKLTDDAKNKLRAAYDALAAADALPTLHAGNDGGGNGNGSDKPPVPPIQGSGGSSPSLDDEVKARNAAHAANMRRVAAIDQLQAKYSTVSEVLLADGKTKQGVAEFLAAAIEAGTAPDAVELTLLRASRAPTQTGMPAIITGGSSSTLNAETVCASMCLTAGMGEKFVAEQVPASQREQVMNAAASGPMKGFSLHALMDLVCHAAGRPFFGNRKSDEFIRASIASERQVLAAGGFSTISLSGILSNVANKAMLASYQAQEVVWPQICGIRSHNDFKVHTRYRLDASGSFRKVGPDGELKHVGLTDASYTNQLDTFGALISLTRQMQYNDDLNAFLELPTILGRMSAVRKEEAVFVLWLSNPSNFFHASNANLQTGAGSALSIEALRVSVQAFTDQVDTNHKPILVSPAILLCGTALRQTAETLYKEKIINEATSAKPAQTPNPHIGLYRPVVSPYINNTAIKDQDGAAITGQSSTKWWLLANPAVRTAIAIAFLNGKQTPTIESSDAEFQTLGMQWRAYDDFGVGMEEPVAAQQNNGV